MSRYLWGHPYYLNITDRKLCISSAFHQLHISKTASLMPRVVIQTGGELLWTKAHTTITEKIPTHSLALKTTGLWDSISMRPEQQNNTLVSHCTGEVGQWVKKLWPFWFCNLSWRQENSTGLQNYVYIVIGLFRATCKAWARVIWRANLWQTTLQQISQQCVC